MVVGDHAPKHVHVYRDGRLIAKVEVPGMLVLAGTLDRKLQMILSELVEENKI
jgi:hypothetical protein